MRHYGYTFVGSLKYQYVYEITIIWLQKFIVFIFLALFCYVYGKLFRVKGSIQKDRYLCMLD